MLVNLHTESSIVHFKFQKIIITADFTIKNYFNFQTENLNFCFLLQIHLHVMLVNLLEESIIVHFKLQKNVITSDFAIKYHFSFQHEDLKFCINLLSSFFGLVRSEKLV